MQVENEYSRPKGLLPVLGAVMLIVGILLASVFVFRLQPVYVQPAPPVKAQQGVANIVMPPGVGADSSLNFSPANATVIIGVNNTVVWTNDDSAAHTVVSKTVPAGAQPFQSGVMSTGDTFNVTLTVPGVYDYFCSIHPLWMDATVVVKGNASAPQAAGAQVVMPSGVGSSESLNYQPDTITVVIGVNNTVTWVNKDTVIHTVTAVDKSFNSGNIQPGGAYTYTFTTPGTYDYFCIYHSWMKGTVIVKAGG